MGIDVQTLAEMAEIFAGPAPEWPKVGCLRCQSLIGIFDDNFCDRCLVVMGCITKEQLVDALSRYEWDTIQERRHPGVHRPIPGDPPVIRPYTGPKGGSLFDKVKTHVDLAEFAGRYTQLRRAGPGKLKGPCPLHQESTGSFYIFEDKRTWRCFGACANGGDVIKLAQLMFSLETPKDAALHLAQEFGIPISRSRNPHRPKAISFEVRG